MVKFKILEAVNTCRSYDIQLDEWYPKMKMLECRSNFGTLFDKKNKRVKIV